MKAPKRAILAVVGIALLFPIIWIGLEILARPTTAGVTLLALLLGGAVGGPFLLSRWERWPALQPETRWGAVLATSYLTPFVLLLLVRSDHPEDVLTINLPVAVGIAALWWACWGYRLEKGDRTDARG